MAKVEPLSHSKVRFRALIPDSRRAPSSRHGDDLFVELALRFGALTGIDLGDEASGHPSDRKTCK